MVKFVNIRNREYVFVDQIKELIDEQLSLVFDYDIRYFTAQNPRNNEHVLVFEIISPQLGNIYRKTYILKDTDVINEMDDMFIGLIMGDFAIISLVSITKTIIRKRDKKVKSKIDLKDMAAHPITDKPFSRGHIIQMNMN